MKYFRVVVNDDLYEKVLVKCENESLSISAYLRRLIIQDIRHTPSPMKSHPEAILFYLNRKAKAIISRAFYATPVNLCPIESLLTKYKRPAIEKAIDKAIERKFTKEQLDPESLFLPENFEKLLEETKAAKKKPQVKSSPKQTETVITPKQRDPKDDPFYDLLDPKDYGPNKFKS